MNRGEWRSISIVFDDTSNSNEEAEEDNQNQNDNLEGNP